MWRILTAVWHSRRRLLAGLMCGLLAWLALLPAELAAVTRSLLAFDIGVAVYLLLIGLLMRQAGHETVQQRSQQEDEGGGSILLLTVCAAGVSLWAIFGELGISQTVDGRARTLHILLAVSTIILSWLFIHVMFALHYAGLYYRNVAAGQPPCLLFPDRRPTPDYGDFVYFACIIGTSAQTADVSFASSAARRIGLLHSVLAFFYNTAVLALLVNMASGLLG